VGFEFGDQAVEHFGNSFGFDYPRLAFGRFYVADFHAYIDMGT